MPIKRRKPIQAYGFSNPIQNVPPMPIIANRAPTTSDIAEVGALFLDTSGNDAYVLLEVASGAASWLAIGAGSPIVDSLTVNPGNLTVTAGDLDVTAGDFEVTAGTVTIGALSTAGVLFNTAAGLVQSNAGTDGQVIIAATGAAPAFASIVSGDGSMSITTGANSLDLRVTGAAASTFPTDAGTATPVLGATTIAGGTNVNTSAAGGTVTINVDNNPTFSGLVTAQAGITQSAGTTTITSDTNAAEAIYLHANGGVNESIRIHSDQGTGATAVDIEADLGGVSLVSGLAGAAALVLNASNAAGGIDVDYGTGGINIAGANGAFTVTSGTAAISIGADAAAHTCTFGSVTGAAATVVQSGTGNLALTSTDAITLDSAGVLELNSSAGVIGIGNDAVAQNINVGTGAAARTITIGNASGASSTVINVGSGNLDLGVNATAHTTRLGSTTGASATTIQTGSGAMTFTAGGAFDVNGVGAITLDSTGGAISIGADADAQAINVGTGAAARTITVGNVTGATSVVVDVGTGNADFGVSATAHTTRVGSTTGASATTIQAGSGAVTVTAGGIFDLNGVGAVTIDSTGGAINIGADADAQAINVGTGAAARTVTIGNATGASSVVVDCGTGAASFGASATAHTTTVGSTTGASATNIQAGTGGIYLESAGIMTSDVVTDTDATGPGATASVTVTANVGQAIMTGFTTAAAGTLVVTINNANVTTGSVIICSAHNEGANDCQFEITRVKRAAGSFEVTLTNVGAAACNGTVAISFWIPKY